MVNLNDPNLKVDEEAPSSCWSFTFADFPEDIQLCILSFLTPSEITSFSCTSKHFQSLCRSDSKLWFSMCDRMWGSKTHISKWGNGQIKFKSLYKTLKEWEELMGFWHRGLGIAVSIPLLVFFEWGPSFITGSWLLSSETSTYQIIKSPFLWMGLSPEGEPMNLLDPDCRFESSGDFVSGAELGFSDADLVPVNISFKGKRQIIVEENLSFDFSYSREETKKDDPGIVEDVIGVESTLPGSLSDRLMLENYDCFANRISPSGERAFTRRRKGEKEWQERRKWERAYFVKIATLSRL